MTPDRLSLLAFNRVHATRQRRLGALLGLSLLASSTVGLVACGPQSSDAVGSTDTGNPPVIADQKLRVTASEDGVVVLGEPGAVTARAHVEVTNLSTSESRETIAEADGSFEVELPGAVTDRYRVEAELNGKRTSANVSASSSEPELDGHTFLLESAEGYTLVENTTIRLSFRDGELSFSAGCNSHGGEYSLCDGTIIDFETETPTLLCTSGFASTEIGCDTEHSAQDRWLITFFGSTPSLSYEPPRLTIEGADATFRFLDREEADPDRPLTGRVWNIDTFFSGGAASNIPLASVPTVEFRDDGSFRAFDTCNTLQGSYAVNSQELNLSDVSITDMYCEAGLAAQQHIGQVLNDGTVSFEIQAARLTLMRGEIGVGATTE